MPQVAGDKRPYLNMVTRQLEDMLQSDATGIDAAGDQIKEYFPGLTLEQSRLIDEAVADLRRREAGLFTFFSSRNTSSATV